jgi:hypothetical protein
MICLHLIASLLHGGWISSWNKWETAIGQTGAVRPGSHRNRSDRLGSDRLYFHGKLFANQLKTRNIKFVNLGDGGRQTGIR